MADFSALRTTMVDTQVRPSDVTKFPIIEAMLTVAREAYVPENLREAAYVGESIDLGNGREILEPRNFAKMLDALAIQPDELVLDIGCGYGYSSAVIARLAEAVIALEENPVMAAEAERRLGENGADNVALIEGELAAGAAKHGPYDVIVVEGAVETLPAALAEQLKDDGRIVAIFAEGPLGICRIGHKSNGYITWRYAFNANAKILPGFEKEIAFVL